MGSTKRKIQVRIAGVELRLMTDEDEGGVRQLAEEVDGKIDAVRRQTGTADTSQLLALALLNLAKENQMRVETERGAAAAYVNETADWIDQLSARIEAVL